MPKKPTPDALANRAASALEQAGADPQRARVSGRTDPEDVMADLVAVVDMEVQRLKRKVEKDEPLSPGESATMANFGRVLVQLIQARATKKPEEADLGDDDLEKQARAIRKKYAKEQPGAPA